MVPLSGAAHPALGMFSNVDAFALNPDSKQAEGRQQRWNWNSACGQPIDIPFCHVPMIPFEERTLYIQAGLELATS